MNKLVLLSFLLVLLSNNFDAPSVTPCKYLQVGDGYCELCGNQAICKYVRFVPELSDDIKTLELEGNKITEINSISFSHKKYTQIRLGNNSISRVAENTFSDLKKLRELDLSNNQIKFLNENIFENNSKLKILSLAANPDLKFSLHKLPHNLEKLYLENTTTVMLLEDLKKLKNLQSYKGHLCVDHSCTINVQLETTLPTHTTHTSEACNLTCVVKEKETKEGISTNCSNNIQGSLTSNDTNYINIEKLLNHSMNGLEDFRAINRSFTDLLSKVTNDIHKIHYQYYHITAQIDKMIGLLHLEKSDNPTWLILMIIITVLQTAIVSILGVQLYLYYYRNNQ